MAVVMDSGSLLSPQLFTGSLGLAVENLPQTPAILWLKSSTVRERAGSFSQVYYLHQAVWVSQLCCEDDVFGL